MDYDGLYEDSMKLYMADIYSGENVISCNSDLMEQHRNIMVHTKDENYISTVTSQSFQTEAAKQENNITENILLISENVTFNLADFECISKANVLLIIKQKFPIKEVWIKKRKTWATTAMLELGDSYANIVELVMWGKQCKHMLSVSPGCVVYVSQVTASDFHGRRSIKMSKNSTLINLGLIHNLLTCGKVAKFHQELDKLVKMYPNFSQTVNIIQNPLQNNVKFCSFSELDPGTLAHVRAKVSAVHSEISDLYSSKPQRITITILGHSQPCNMFLHGSSKSWRRKITFLRRQVWEFFFVACTSSTENDIVELQTTVISVARSLFGDDDRVKQSTHQETVQCIENLLPFLGSETNSTIEVDGVCTNSIQCTLGTRRLLLTKETPLHIIHTTIKRCCLETQKPMVTMMAHCYFSGDATSTLFNMKICRSKHKSDALKSIVTNLILGVTRLRITSFQRRTHDDNAQNMFVFMEQCNAN